MLQVLSWALCVPSEVVDKRGLPVLATEHLIHIQRAGLHLHVLLQFQLAADQALLGHDRQLGCLAHPGGWGVQLPGSNLWNFCTLSRGSYTDH